MMESYENKVVDDAQSGQIWFPTVTQEQAVNKNIEELKKLPKTEEMFSEINTILNKIATEKDYNAMSFAVKEKFCDVRNMYYETIFEHSINDENVQLARLILEFGENYKFNNSFPIDSEFVRFVLKTRQFNAKMALNAKDESNFKALIYASKKGYHEVVKLLLTVPGIDVNAKDKYNKTALIYASIYGNDEIVKLLLTVPGIDINAKDKYNNTALTWASWCGHHEVVKLLLTVPGIDVNPKDNDNNTSNNNFPKATLT